MNILRRNVRRNILAVWCVCVRVRTVVEYNINMRVHAAMKWRQVPNIQHKYYTMSGSHELTLLQPACLRARYIIAVYNSDLSNIQEYHV